MRYAFIKYAAEATLAAGIVFAQTPGPGPMRGGTGTEEGQHGFMSGHMNLEHMAQVLNLTSTQKEQARTIFQQADESAQPIREEMKQNREKLRAAEKMNASESEIQRLSGEQGRLMGKLIAIHTQASAKFYRLLTPEQRVKDDQMHKEMRQRMRSNNPRTHSDE